MNATISYRMEHIPHPFDDKQRAAGVYAWCLVKWVTPELGESACEPVALFNLDSEAVMFQGHIASAGLNKLIGIPEGMIAIFDSQKRIKAQHK